MIFPADITGNIRSVSDPDEKVIGYIGASVAQEKRIFILRNELPTWTYTFQCETKYVENHPDSIVSYFKSNLYIPYERKGFIDGYFSSSSRCLDCRERGSSVKPSFW